MVADFIVGIILGGLLFMCIDMLIVRPVSKKHHEDIKKIYQSEVNDARKNEDDYRSKYLSAMYDKAVLESKVEMLKKMLNKFYGEKSNTTDSLFIFEGKCYRPRNFHLTREAYQPDTLDVEFEHVSMDLTTDA